jgi:hypothetical protein
MHYQQPAQRKRLTWVWVLVGVLLVCGLGGVGIIGAILFPVFAQAKQAAIRTSCMVNLKQISQAQLLYSADADGRFPDAARWIDQSEAYNEYERSFTCPAVKSQGRQFGYAFNAAVSKKKAADLKDRREVLLYESGNLQRNASGDPSKEPPTNRHLRGRTESYCDGSVKFVRAPR